MLRHGDASAISLRMRVWMGASGSVERIEFDGLADPDAAVDLRALLMPVQVSAPPPDMLQPLRMRLSLRLGHPPKSDAQKKDSQ